MTRCAVHNDFFDDECIECKKEYSEMKGGYDNISTNIEDNENIANNDKDEHKKKIYKEFTEERAKNRRACKEIVRRIIISISQNIDGS